jgi:hypothetical protein
MVGVAQGVNAVVIEIGLPMVVAQHAVESGKDTHLVDRFPASFLVRVVAGSVGVRYAVQPESFSVLIDAGFVHMA